jgi:hypothetical protein
MGVKRQEEERKVALSYLLVRRALTSSDEATSFQPPQESAFPASQQHHTLAKGKQGRSCEKTDEPCRVLARADSEG